MVGIVVGLSGLYLLMKYTQNRIFFSDAYITLPAICAFASAVVLVVSAFVGSWLSLRDSMCLQGWVRQFLCVFINVSVFDQHIIKRVFFLQFVLLLVLVFCLESTASALAYFHTKNVCKLHTHTKISLQIILETNLNIDTVCASFLFSWIQK